MSLYPALKNRNFKLLWSGLIVSNVGTWMQNVAQSWLIYKMTGNDPLYLGWLGLAFSIPMVVVPPIGGIVADRVDRVRLLYATQTSAMVLAVVLSVLTWRGLLLPWHILVATFTSALLLAFDNPARQSLIPELVPRSELQNALSLNAATFTGAALVGPAVAGLLLEQIGAAGLFFMNAVSYLAVIGALGAMRELPVRAPATGGLRDALFGGFAYLARDRVTSSLVGLAAIAALCARSYPQLLPIFADDVWHAGPRGYGALLSAGGAGALLGAFGLATLREIRTKGLVLLGSGVCLAAALVGFAFAPSVAVAAPLLVAAGIAATVFTTMISTVIQLRVPPELRGRVISLYVITLIGMPSLGALGLAAIARALGMPGGAARAIIGGAIVLLVALAACARPVLGHLRKVADKAP